MFHLHLTPEHGAKYARPRRKSHITVCCLCDASPIFSQLNQVAVIPERGQGYFSASAAVDLS